MLARSHHTLMCLIVATREEYDEADADKSGEIDWDEYHAILVSGREQGEDKQGAGSKGSRGGG